MNRKWIWIGAAVVVLAIIGAMTRDADDEPADETVSSEVDSVTIEPYVPDEPMNTPTLPAVTERDDLVQSELESVVSRSVSSAFQESISVDGRHATVILKENDSEEVYRDYFRTGDKANKVLAIESARWFRELPSLERLTLTVPGSSGTTTVDLKRHLVEKWYAVDFDALHLDESLDKWREQISRRHDNKRSRAEFVEQFSK